MNSKAAFCGLWRLDVGRSHFGFLPPPEYREDRLLVSDERIRIESRQGDEDGEFLVCREVAATGVPAEIDVRGRKRWCRGWWDGVEMVLEQEWEQGGNPRKVIDRWRLARLGKEICLRREHVMNGGNVRQVLYFERAEELSGLRDVNAASAAHPPGEEVTRDGR